jgi:hypothetical protein
MTHLDDQRLIDAAEGRIESAAARHLEACANCRASVRDLQDVLTRVALVEEPAPSPLFWEHFRARVSDALDADVSPAQPPVGLGFRWLSMASLALTLALVTVAVITSRSGNGAGNAPLATAGVPAVPVEPLEDLGEDEAWILVRSLAAELDYEAAREAGVTPAPGAVERAAAELSPSEQSALIQLLEQEMKRTDS